MKIETTISRQWLLARLPAVTVAMVPVTTTAFPGLPASTKDPVYAAIEAHIVPLRKRNDDLRESVL